MKKEEIENIFLKFRGEIPAEINRCAVGFTNEVYKVKVKDEYFILRCSVSKDSEPYKESEYVLKVLREKNLPVPAVLFKGREDEYGYIIISFTEGEDLGLVYKSLCKEEKAFIFYSLVYTVDFMGERGMTFGDKTVEVSREIIERLDNIYNYLFNKWQKLNGEI